MCTLKTDGYEIIRSVLSEDKVAELRIEADRVVAQANSVCVRHLRANSKVFDELSASEKILNLISSGLSPVRSILFDKTPLENWPVAWHQDLTIAVEDKEDVDGYGPWSFKDGVVHVQPPVDLLNNMATIRIHLDETPESNGALRVVPATHNLGKIASKDIKRYTGGSSVTCNCSAGDVLLISPLILHSSRRSEVPERRRVIHFEYACLCDLDSQLTWHEHNQKERTRERK